MGREYRVILDESDHHRIHESVPHDDPKSIDELLRMLPGYIKGSAYEYKTRTEGCNCRIGINGSNLDLLVYGPADQEPIIQTLYSYLIAICGRFQIEDL